MRETDLADLSQAMRGGSMVDIILSTGIAAAIRREESEGAGRTNSWHALNSRGTKGNYTDVKVCWRYSGRNPKGFQNFLLDFGIKPRGRSIDRKNPSRGYYKSNMRWATPREQAVNKILSLTAIAAKAWRTRRGK